MHTRLEVLGPTLRGTLRLYARFAPHMIGTDKNNPAWWFGLDGRNLFDVQREEVDMSFGCMPDFTTRSVGYVGFSDGWQDLMSNFKMDWEFEQAEDGNIALIGEIDLSRPRCG
jgi:glucoamylase